MNQPVLLLAEDEPIIQLALEEALIDGGYSVVTTSNGLEAVAVIEERHAELSAIVTDIQLGRGPDGWELAHRARELSPSICVVYITGDSADKWTAEGVPKSILLQKPFADAQIVTAVSTLMNGLANDIPM